MDDWDNWTFFDGTVEEMEERIRRAAAWRVLGCEIDAVPRTLLGCDIADMDSQTAADWYELISHLNTLFYADEERRDNECRR